MDSLLHRPYDLVIAPPAVRAIESALPEPVAAAVIEFITGPLLLEPRRHRIHAQVGALDLSLIHI